MLSLRSEATPEVFFGQQIQSMPVGRNFAAYIENVRSNSRSLVTNSNTRSIGLRARVLTVTFAGSSNSWSSAAGAFTKRRLKPSLIPSFLASGVPEYPAIKVLHGGSIAPPRKRGGVGVGLASVPTSPPSPLRLRRGGKEPLPAKPDNRECSFKFSAANLDRQKNEAILNFESSGVQDVCASGIRAWQISQLINKDAD